MSLEFAYMVFRENGYAMIPKFYCLSKLLAINEDDEKSSSSGKGL